jgi:hypothetical protein
MLIPTCASRGKFMFKRLSNLSNRAVLGILLAVALASSGLSLVVNIVNNVDTSPAWWVSWLQNFSTEMFGAFLTFVLIELIVGGREKRRDTERATAELKERLIRQMGSRVNEEATRAVEELEAHGWLHDGSLQSVGLLLANLQGVRMWAAELKWAYLRNANLQEADLAGANLQQADLVFTNLLGANLRVVNLQQARISEPNLQKACLINTNLKGTGLEGSDLQEAEIENAQFDENTILPDYSNWTPNTDMHRFTNPTHPQFWRSDEPRSPAYRGKDMGV